MTNRMRQLRLRDAVLFVVFVAVVAMVVVMIGRELGIGGQATATIGQASVDSGVAEATATPDVPDAAPEANPDANETGGGTFRDAGESAGSQIAASDLSLSLSAPAICETDDGFYGSGIGETPVAWEVTGGTGPYTLDIDGETRDASQDYVGQTGTASVSCALETGDVHYEDLTDEPYRDLEGDYLLDSGLKTIRAVVTDASGKTREATVDVYVILSTGRHEHLLRGGHTYRVFGRLLLTIPPEVDFRIGETSSDGTFSLTVNGSDYQAVIWLDDDTFSETYRFLPQSGELARGLAVEGADYGEIFDTLVDSFGKLPKPAQSSAE